MKASTLVPAAALLMIIANIQSAHAAFIGTFNPVPEPSSMALFAIGAGAAAAAYLKKRKREK